jgi:hypothetical protein
MMSMCGRNFGASVSRRSDPRNSSLSKVLRRLCLDDTKQGKVIDNSTAQADCQASLSFFPAHADSSSTPHRILFEQTCYNKEASFVLLLRLALHCGVPDVSTSDVQKACGQDSPYIGHACVADEHYIPTLLAAYGLDKSRDGVGCLTYADWTYRGGATWHPRTFPPSNPSYTVASMRSKGPFSGCAYPISRYETPRLGPRRS